MSLAEAPGSGNGARQPDDLGIDREPARERQLWCAVIIHTLYEAAGRIAYAEKGERERVRQAAIAWFDEAGADFREVCDLAGLAPEVVREGALRLIGSLDLPRKRDSRPSKDPARPRRRDRALTASI